jgi:hypothetical protein
MSDTKPTLRIFGRPPVSEPRSETAAIRLTKPEYDGLIQLAGRRCSISDIGRELLNEAVAARLAAGTLRKQ